ncbi:hypothetical protein ACWX0P_16355 [Vibrio mediterranei]
MVIKYGDGNDFIRDNSSVDDLIDGGKGNDFILGKQGDDKIKGGKGDDIVEGNRGNDDLKGGSGEDLLFGGVGNDTLIGGDDADIFSMRVWKGGDNTISDFTLGEDALQLVFNRKHYVLENDIVEKRITTKKPNIDEQTLETKVSNRENDLAKSLNGDDGNKGQVDKAFSKLNDGIAAQWSDDQNKANEFVDYAVEEGLSITKDGDDLVLTFFDFNPEAERNLGTNIRLKDVLSDEDNPLVKQIKYHLESNNNSPSNESIIALLSNPELTAVGTNADEEIGVVSKAESSDSIPPSITDGDDNVDALGGKDTIKGSKGNDILNGGDGIDTASYINVQADLNVSVEEGNVEVVKAFYDGSRGIDTLTEIEHIMGGRGNDVVDFSGLENAYINTSGNTYKIWPESIGAGEEFGLIYTDDNQGAGNEDITGSKFNDYIDTRHGDDIIRGGDGDDRLTSTYGSNELYGGAGNDTLRAGGGDDYLDGGDGIDFISAGAGNDTIRTATRFDYHNDTVDGGNGDDELIYDGNPTNKGSGVAYFKMEGTDSNTFTVSIFEGTETNAKSIDTIHNVEIINGSHGNDIVDFSSLTHSGMTFKESSSGASDDTVKGTNLADNISVQHGKDTVYGLGGDDIINASGGDDILYGGEGADTINSGGGNDEIFGGEGDDVYLNAGGGNDKITGGAGNDKINGNTGDDTLIYENKPISVTAIGGNWYEVNAGDEGIDTVREIEFIQWSDGMDEFSEYG